MFKFPNTTASLMLDTDDKTIIKLNLNGDSVCSFWLHYFNLNWSRPKSVFKDFKDWLDIKTIKKQYELDRPEFHAYHLWKFYGVKPTNITILGKSIADYCLQDCIKYGATHKCIHSECGGVAYYLKPYINCEVAGLHNNPSMTAFRMLPDATEPIMKSCECWTCGKWLNYADDTKDLTVEIL